MRHKEREKWRHLRVGVGRMTSEVSHDGPDGSPFIAHELSYFSDAITDTHTCKSSNSQNFSITRYKIHGKMNGGSSNPPKHLKVVFFDVQSTGFGPNHEVIQLAAKCRDRTFSAYILPRDGGGIPEDITDMTGLYINDHDDQMYDKYNNHQDVDAVSKEEAVSDFIEFLRSLSQKILLVGFNCFAFDGPMLAGLINETGMAGSFMRLVWGFSDALSIMKKGLRHRHTIPNGFRLKKLANDYLHENCRGRDSFFQVDWLQRLVWDSRIDIADYEFIEISKSSGRLINDTSSW